MDLIRWGYFWNVVKNYGGRRYKPAAIYATSLYCFPILQKSFLESSSIGIGPNKQIVDKKFYYKLVRETNQLILLNLINIGLIGNYCQF